MTQYQMQTRDEQVAYFVEQLAKAKRQADDESLPDIDRDYFANIACDIEQLLLDLGYTNI